MKISLAFFISQHGFGHAARACAIIEALLSISPKLDIHIFSTAQEWFFRQSLLGKITFHPYRVDVGLIQKSFFEEDIPATISQLQTTIPYANSYLDPLIHELREIKCSGIVCDIAPTGIQIAQQMGLPSFLVENFTWDWILDGYKNEFPELENFIEFFRSLNSQATYHIQTEPICEKRKSHLRISPISRRARTSPDEIRLRLNIPPSNRMVVISLGENYKIIPIDLDAPPFKNISFIWITPSPLAFLSSNHIYLTSMSEFYHPDLIQAADALIAKAGYSTLAEAYRYGTPFGFILRDKFPESKVLHQYILENRLGKLITKQDFNSPAWTTHLESLLAMPKSPRPCIDAEIVAQFILSHI